MFEGWIELCPMTGESIRFTDCIRCENFTRLDCIFIVCGYKGRYSKKKICYREIDQITDMDNTCPFQSTKKTD